MSRILTPEQVALADTTGRQPFNEPTEVVPAPTDAEMAQWQPSRDPTRVRYRKEVNVATGEVKHIELTDDEYRARHVAKIVSRNEYVQRKQEEQRAARRKQLLEKFLDDLEKQS